MNMNKIEIDDVKFDLAFLEPGYTVIQVRGLIDYHFQGAENIKDFLRLTSP